MVSLRAANDHIARPIIVWHDDDTHTATPLSISSLGGSKIGSKQAARNKLLFTGPGSEFNSAQYVDITRT